MNKAALTSIIDSIIYLGPQCLALRGHRDDYSADPTKNKGNLHTLIEFRCKTDTNMRMFLDTCPSNATYTTSSASLLSAGLLTGVEISTGVCRIHLQKTGSIYSLKVVKNIGVFSRMRRHRWSLPF